MTIVMSSPDKVGKYRITGVIGEGVSGVVYKAFDPQLQRVVAVKSLQRELPVDSRGAQAFASRLREQAQAVTRLAHPGIVAIHEIDESDGRAFIAMEHVAGLNLGQWLAVTPLPAQAVLLQVMDQLLDALECAHLSGVRHGDLKPSNVLVTGSGAIKITDFGLARAEGRAVAFSGVAPEYQAGRLIDHRVDVYGAGAILYRMLVGRDAFVSDTSDGMSLGATLRPPSMVTEAQRPAYFDGVVAKAMAHDPNQRFASAAEFRDALRDANEQRLPELGAGVVTISPSGRVKDPSADVPVIGDTPVPPDALAARSSSSRDAPTGEAAASVPMLTIAIPDSVLSMPSYDPWANRGRMRDKAHGNDDRRESAMASNDPSPEDEAYAAFRDQVDRDRRSTVVSAAAAATAALSAAADTAEAARIAAAARAAVQAPSPRNGMPTISLPPSSGPTTVSGSLTITGSVKAPRSKIDLTMPIGSIYSPPPVPEPAAKLQEQVELSQPTTAGEEIPAEALRRVLKVLSAHLGPVAGEVLKHVAGRARSIPELHKLLLEQAGDGVDKKRMAKQLKAVAKLPL